MLIDKEELCSILYLNGISFDPYYFNSRYRFNHHSVPICLVCDEKGEVYLCTISTESADDKNEYHYHRSGTSSLEEIHRRKKIKFEDTIIVIGGYIPNKVKEYHSNFTIDLSLQGCKNMIGINELLKTLTKREKELRLHYSQLIDNVTVVLNDRLLQR